MKTLRNSPPKKREKKKEKKIKQLNKRKSTSENQIKYLITSLSFANEAIDDFTKLLKI